MYLHSFGFTALIPSDITYPNPESGGTGNKYPVGPAVPGKEMIPATKYAPLTAQEYYATIDVNNISDVKEHITTMTKQNYGDARFILQYTDAMPNPAYMYGMWDGDHIVTTWDEGVVWQREHVWPCDRMQLDGKDPRPDNSTKNHTTDLHNLRVACAQSNNYHSNKFIGEPNSSTVFFPNLIEGLINGTHRYEGDHRGDVARIYFYMALRYDGLTLTSTIPTSKTAMYDLSKLLEWNLADPVDEFELQRNARIYEYQGNRNPFIDFPNLANQINWGV